jgi:type I restriction enzyme S subunit
MQKLPNHWNNKRLEEVCLTIVGGGTPTTSKPEYWDGDIPWISSADVHGLRDIRPRRTITEKGLKESTTNLLPKGGIIVVTRVGLGKIAVAPYDVCFSQDSQGLILNEAIITKPYALFYLSRAVQRFKHESRGTTISGVTKKQLNEVTVPIPPIEEQERIVAKIEELFSELDAGVESLKKAQAQLKTYRQAVLKSAFEGKLTNENVANGELPEGWNWVELDELMESVRNGYPRKPDDRGSVPILRISSVRPFRIDLSDVRFLVNPLDDANSIRENDLLFTRYNGSRDFVGVAARVPSLNRDIFYPDKLIRCRPKNNSRTHSTYLQYAANIGRAREFVLSKIKTTAGQTGISGGEIKQIPIPICSPDEQDRIVAEIESRLSVCDKLEENIAASLKQSEALRQSILKQAFEGKLI